MGYLLMLESWLGIELPCEMIGDIKPVIKWIFHVARMVTGIALSVLGGYQHAYDNLSGNRNRN
ncbi:unnamed protein product [Oppiella nova]|uniref:Uncharacterized protein n=1 Tax=Oppiella nova TaxID=334625 RepID=A0A7R9LRF3_9ACAR|nr:unnamed protein product [Oppiella nova]CAG2165875.1 unnamed protein product [Oppiella nova]